jgi:pyruvate/2-oxoglutarate/acetoin dehydrogenase E1 component
MAVYKKKPNKYLKALIDECTELAKLPNTIFLGQQVAKEISDFYGILVNVPAKKRVEMPVAEELQMGISLGLALEGYLPISIFQRMDFLPRAADQLINHLDLTEDLSRGLYKPKVLIITTVGSMTPLNVGLQHNKNLSRGFKHLLKNINVYELKNDRDVHKYFTKAKKSKTSSTLVFFQDLAK